jgi:uracil-DNA glycosylase family 4
MSNPKIAVPAEGPKTAKIAIIGEAPGFYEAQHKRPFVGKSGQMLDQVLNSVGILRRDCYVTNVLKFKPHNNRIEPYVKVDKKGVNVAERGEVAQEYLDYLNNELGQLNECNIFIPLGNVSLWALTNKWGITDWRGSVIPATLSNIKGRKVLPSIHPAGILRGQMERKYWLGHDLLVAKRESNSPHINKKERIYKVRPSFKEAMSYLERIYIDKVTTAFDIETIGQNISCIGFSLTPMSAICIPFIDRTGNYYGEEEEMLIWKMIAKILEDPHITKIAQNANFDMTIINNDYGIRPTNVEDTMIAHSLLYPDFPKSLAFQTSMMTDMPYYKWEGKESSWGTIGDEDQFWEYNAKDCCATHECWLVLSKLLWDRNMLETYQKQRDLLYPIMFMQRKGIWVDKKGLIEFSLECKEKITNIQKEIDEITGGLNVGSPKQMKEYFYGDKKDGGMGIKPYINRNTKKPRVDDDALKRIARQGYPVATLCREIRKVKKLQGTYLDVQLDERGHLCATYNPVGTRTGRLSSQTNIYGYGTNLQNIPPSFKKYMFASPGYVIFEVDLSQAENRIVAYAAPDRNMIDAFERGIDIHSQTYAMMFGMKTEEVSRDEETSPIGDGSKSQRFWGKQFNHSLNYGLGANSFAIRVDISQREATKLVNRYHQVYPNVRQGFQRRIEDELRSSRTVTNPYGRVRKFIGTWGPEMFKDAYAQFPQSTVADKINRDGLIELYNNQDKYHEVEILNQVHDSIVFQIPIAVGWERITWILFDIKDALERPIPWNPPFVIPADFKIGLSLGDMIDINMCGKKEVCEQLSTWYDQHVGNK